MPSLAAHDKTKMVTYNESESPALLQVDPVNVPVFLEGTPQISLCSASAKSGNVNLQKKSKVSAIPKNAKFIGTKSHLPGSLAPTWDRRRHPRRTRPYQICPLDSLLPTSNPATCFYMSHHLDWADYLALRILLLDPAA